MARLGGWDPEGLQVTSISPVSGPVAGGTTMIVRGYGFVAGATVAVGGVAATGVVVAGSTSLTAVTGAHATGLADVTVTIPGPRSAMLAQGFFYAPPPTPADYYTLTPCRLVDTRASQAPALAASERRVFTITGGACGVPATAKAVAVNVTVTGATAPDHVRLAPGNGLTDSSAINFLPGLTRADNGVVMLATDGTGGVFATNGSTGAVHLVLDVRAEARGARSPVHGRGIGGEQPPRPSASHERRGRRHRPHPGCARRARGRARRRGSLAGAPPPGLAGALAPGPCRSSTPRGSGKP
jgi:hypothetical protein